MIISTENASTQKVEKKLNSGLPPDTVDPSTDETLLLYASRIGNIKLAKLMVRKNWKINAVNQKGENAYMIAWKYSNFEIADFLQYWGAKQDATNSGGQNVLHCAVKGKNHELIKTLVARGVSVNWGDS